LDQFIENKRKLYPNHNFRYPNYNFRYPYYNFRYPNYNFRYPNYNFRYPNYNLKHLNFNLRYPNFNIKYPNFIFVKIKKSSKFTNKKMVNTLWRRYKTIVFIYSTQRILQNFQTYLNYRRFWWFYPCIRFLFKTSQYYIGWWVFLIKYLPVINKLIVKLRKFFFGISRSYLQNYKTIKWQSFFTIPTLLNESSRILLMHQSITLSWDLNSAYICFLSQFINFFQSNL
jgi:hypothetical protein